MPWTTQGGGGGQGPWGGGPSGPQPPNLEDLLRSGQDRLRSVFSGGGGRGFFIVVLVVAAVWLVSGFYRVQPGEQGVELLFGKYVQSTTPGLNYWFPWPFGQVATPNVERTNTINVGFRGPGQVRRGAARRGAAIADVREESLMLTGDLNIIDIDFVVQWRIQNAADFLFNIRNPEGTTKKAAESAMREIIGQNRLEDALTVKRQDVEQKTQALLQQILDDYGAGVAIAQVKLLKVDPPEAVIDAFNDVQSARQDKETKTNEAEAYENRIVPTARGEAQKIVQEAEAYKAKVVKDADGEAKRFISVYDSYRVAKDVTIRRLYLETMEEVLRGSEKVIIDQKGESASGVVPYLPLPEVQKRRLESPGGATGGGTQP